MVNKKSTLINYPGTYLCAERVFRSSIANEARVPEGKRLKIK